MTGLRLLDLYCGAGGAARGYQRAGFHVTGVDLTPQPHYAGDVFVQGEALEHLRLHGHEYDAIHASPPCQGYSLLRHVPQNASVVYPRLVHQTRRLLDQSGRPWIIENVPGAPLLSGVVLCGVMFGLKVYRHRGFESSHALLAPPHLSHPVTIGSHRLRRRTLGHYGENAHGFVTVAGHMFSRAQGSAAMEIDWMTREELAQAVPPAYTAFLGRQLLLVLHCPEETAS